jgi:hypothetical protein
MAANYTEARKEPTGWKHILKLKWNGTLTNWHERVVSWGAIDRKVSSWEEALSGGGNRLALADTDMTLWGSFKGANGTNPLWSVVEIESYLGGPTGTYAYPGQGSDAKFGLFRFGDVRFGDILLSGIINKGRITQLENQGDQIILPLYDDILLLNNAKFVWDYTWIGSSVYNLFAYGSGAKYGTIERILNATTITVEESIYDNIKGTLNTLFTNAKFADYSNKWARSDSYGGVASNSILPGDMLKFGSYLLSDADAGSVLVETPGFQVSKGAIFVDSNRSATFATISFTKELFDVKPGAWIYKRVPLKYEGNPAEVVRQMLIGSNTNIGYPSGSISIPHLRAATSACSPAYVQKFIEDDSEGAVLKEIKELSQVFEARYFFDRSGQWVWSPYRPRLRDNIDGVSDWYDGGTVGANTVATNNIVDNPRYMEQTEDVFTDFVMDYDFDHREDEESLQYRGHCQLKRDDVSSRYNGYRNYRNIRTQWIGNRNDAIILGNRFLRNHATAVSRLDFDTSLYGLEQDLDDVVIISHRTGSISQRAFQVNSIGMSLDDDRINLTSEEMSDRHYKSGFGYLMSGSNLNSEASATSTFGWSWPITVGPGTHGTVHSNLGSLEVTLVLYDTLGNQPTNIGVGGITHFITMGSEIMKVTSGATLATKTVLRNQETTKHGSYLVGAGWTAWPMDSNGDIKAIYNGTEMTGTPVIGTSLNINTGTYGTVWRWF